MTDKSLGAYAVAMMKRDEFEEMFDLISPNVPPMPRPTYEEWVEDMIDREHPRWSSYMADRRIWKEALFDSHYGQGHVKAPRAFLPFRQWLQDIEQQEEEGTR